MTRGTAELTGTLEQVRGAVAEARAAGDRETLERITAFLQDWTSGNENELVRIAVEIGLLDEAPQTDRAHGLAFQPIGA